MLEAKSHIKLKQLLLESNPQWPHHLTFSRLVARSLRRKDQTFVQLDSTASQEEWWLGLLVPLSLQACGGVIVLSERMRSRLLKVELPRMRARGLALDCLEGSDPPPDNYLWLLDFEGLLQAHKQGFLKGKQLIVPEAEFLNDKLREVMAIEIKSIDWERLRFLDSSLEKPLISLYEDITLRLFSNLTPPPGPIHMDDADINLVKKLLKDFCKLPLLWEEVSTLNLENWANWIELDYKKLNWKWMFKPLEPIKLLKALFVNQPMILITKLGKVDCQARHFLGDFSPSLVFVKLSETILQEPIPLFLPYRQPLPNTQIYQDYLLDQCRRLILGRKGLTVVLINDTQFRRQLTTALAAEFGNRVVHENIELAPNGVLCSHWNWWLENHHQLPLPEQLIIALLPLASLESPLTAARVQSFKRRGLDWFRGFLLPEALNLLPPAIAPLRRNNGRLAILDGRLRYRSWGKEVLNILEPWVPLDRLLPD